ncbi:hypothetical protein Ancab_032849 [Ancistrocladus abbreviatus]
MGCASSKKIGATTSDVYHPSSTSFAVFDINSIEEPWLKLGAPHQHNQDKSSHVPPPILEKLSSFEQQPSDAPRTWDEISKALEVLKPVPDAATTPPKSLRRLSQLYCWMICEACPIRRAPRFTRLRS